MENSKQSLNQEKLYRWVKASERLPEKDYSFGEDEFGCFPVRWQFEYRTLLGLGYLGDDGKIWNAYKTKPYISNVEWLEEVPHSETSDDEDAIRQFYLWKYDRINKGETPTSFTHWYKTVYSKKASEASHSELIREIHSHLYNAIPVGDLSAYKIIVAVQQHLKWLESLEQKESETSEGKEDDLSVAANKTNK